MNTDKQLKDLVKQKYAEIALQEKTINRSSCCGDGPASKEVYNIMSDRYEHFEGYHPDADLGLGCGLPTQFAKIKKGDTVIDLGSGAGNDCFIARSETGEAGKVIGIDFTTEMIDKARSNAEKLGYHNVEFRQGDIEQMPVNDNVADIIVSNCVLNLVPNKKNVFNEIFRVLKPGGHFSISDIVLQGDLPIKIKEAAELYAGCIAGAIQKSEYLQLATDSGFTNITLQKEKPVLIPDDIMLQYLGREELLDYKKSEAGIVSITLYAEKSGGSIKNIEDKAMTPCCGTDCCK